MGGRVFRNLIASPRKTPIMHKRLSLLLRSALYALRGGFLIRPLVIALFLGAAGAVLSFAEEHVPALNAWIPEVLFPSHQNPQVAQTILAGIASSIMTVVSIIFAILLMTLTLASTQFSPRILVSFVRDRSTQWTLGIFLGTFCFCMAALPAVRLLPHPFVPVATVMTAMMLAVLCVGWLIFFINHISQSISVNHIVDRIARETELVIDDLMPHPRGPSEQAEHAAPFGEARERFIVSRRSGYIRFVDVPYLVECAKSFGVQIILERRVGHFVPAGVPIMRVLEAGRVTPEREEHLLSAFDIGPARTMQQDVEFGVIQIVDVALRAISPAVNDPIYGDQLYRSAQPHPHSLGEPRSASGLYARAAACSACRRALDRFLGVDGYGVRTNPPLFEERYRGQSPADAGVRRHRRRGIGAARTAIHGASGAASGRWLRGKIA